MLENLSNSDSDWKLMEKTVKVLGTFKEATLKLSSASITSILHTLKPSNLITDHGVKDLKRRLRENLNRRLAYIEESEIHSIATLLDPRYIFFILSIPLEYFTHFATLGIGLTNHCQPAMLLGVNYIYWH
jgi:hypothetical protein